MSEQSKPDGNIESTQPHGRSYAVPKPSPDDGAVGAETHRNGASGGNDITCTSISSMR